eukprot:6071537-Pleurochrysis_carterae.AAC.3
MVTHNVAIMQAFLSSERHCWSVLRYSGGFFWDCCSSSHSSATDICKQGGVQRTFLFSEEDEVERCITCHTCYYLSRLLKADIHHSKGTSPRQQFPVMPAWAMTVHKA